MRVISRSVLAASLVVAAGCSTEEKVKVVEVEKEVPVVTPGETVPQECSPATPHGVCEAGETCFAGECVATANLCSTSNLDGLCPDGETCFSGGCVPATALCSNSNPTGPCETGNTCLDGACVATADLCSTSNPDGHCSGGAICQDGVCGGNGGGVTACGEHVYTEQPEVVVRGDITGTATGQKTLNSVVAGNTLTVGQVNAAYPAAGVSFKGVASDPAEGEFLVGADDAATAANLAQVINAHPVASALVTAVAEGNVLRFTAVPAGVLGNGIGLSGSATFAGANVTTGGAGTGKSIITVDGLRFKDGNGNGELDAYEDWRLNPWCRAADLASKMTIPEKVGLMSEGMALGSTSTDGSIASAGRANMLYGHVRQGLVRYSAPGAATAAWANALQEFAEATSYGMPIVITGDPTHALRMSTAIGGTQNLSTSFFSDWPTPLGLGAANDANLTRKFGDTVRKEFMASGLRWQLGPMIDVLTEPRWERVQYLFGSNAISVAAHSGAVIEGMQGSRTGDLRNGIAATAKHFPGAGSNEGGKDSHREQGQYAAHPGGNFEYHLIPFQKAFDVNIASMMACYSIFKDVDGYGYMNMPSGFVRGLVTDLAKTQMGFRGMVTGDWGTAGGSAYGAAKSLTTAQRAALWLQAGSHQFGNDSSSYFQQAYDQGLIGDAEINEAATKILEMTFKLGVFENPYVDADAAATIVRGEETMIDGFNAQKRAIVLLHNEGNLLPLDDADDFDADDVVNVYYDGVADRLSGADALSDAGFLDDYDYTTDTIRHVTDITEADVAVLRISARRGTYFGLDMGVPLAFDAPFPGTQTDSNAPAALEDRNRVVNAFRVRDGYTRADGTVVPAANPDLKIVLVMYMDRPSIVKGFVNGLTTLDEVNGAGSYPLVSDEANVNQTIVAQTTVGAHAGVDAFLVDFGAIDRALLDFLFNQNIPEGVTRHGLARLPTEIPSTEAAVNAQYEDMPDDTVAPTFRVGAGMNL